VIWGISTWEFLLTHRATREHGAQGRSCYAPVDENVAALVCLPLRYAAFDCYVKVRGRRKQLMMH